MLLNGLKTIQQGVLMVSCLLNGGLISQYTMAGEQEMSNKQKVTALLKSIETGDAGPVSFINPDKYIQHNLAVPDGLAGFGAVLQSLPEGSAKVNTVRIFEDGDYVFAHTEYNFFGPKIGFDIFRFENDKIVEHWDNLQVTPDNLNPSGRSMIDGSTELLDRDKSQENKRLVKNFVTDILVKGDMKKLSVYFEGDNYLQHNPNIGDGLSGLERAFEAMSNQGISMEYTKVHKVLGEGNFILVVSEGALADQPTSYYDLFRVENGKIAEHWDTIETIPPRSEWQNENGKF